MCLHHRPRTADLSWTSNWNRPIRIQFPWHSFLIGPPSISQSLVTLGRTSQWETNYCVAIMTSSHWRPVNGWFSDWAWSNILTYFDDFIHYFLLFFLKNLYYVTLYDVLVTFSWHIVFYFTRCGRSVEVKAELKPACCLLLGRPCYCRLTQATKNFRTLDIIKIF